MNHRELQSRLTTFTKPELHRILEDEFGGLQRKSIMHRIIRRLARLEADDTRETLIRKYFANTILEK